MKTAREIIDDFVTLIAASGLPAQIGGGIYPAGQRPRNSTAEDVTVSLTTVDYDDFMPQGVITLNVFIQGKAQGETRTVRADDLRIVEVERILQNWIDEHKGRFGFYLIWQKDPIGSDVVPSPTIQYFAYLRLTFHYLQSLNNNG